MDDNYRVDLIRYYEKLLKQGFAYNNTRKYYLRMRLWWAVNDLVRYSVPFYKLFKILIFEGRLRHFLKDRYQQRKLFKSFNLLFKYNVEQLILLVDPEDEDADFLLAEMNREIGKFKSAKKYITESNGTNSFVAKRLKRAIFYRKKLVFQF